MHFSRTTNVVLFIFGLAVKAQLVANPLERRFARIPFGIAGRDMINNGLVKRANCPTGQATCGSGCTVGPCCDASLGLSCRADEYCATVEGDIACCATGYACSTIRPCANADSPGCTPGQLNNGILCCDASAPFCNSAGARPYCQAYIAGVEYGSIVSTHTVGGPFPGTATTALAITTGSLIPTSTIVVVTTLPTLPTPTTNGTTVVTPPAATGSGSKVKVTGSVLVALIGFMAFTL